MVFNGAGARLPSHGNDVKTIIFIEVKHPHATSITGFTGSSLHLAECSGATVSGAEGRPHEHTVVRQEVSRDTRFDNACGLKPGAPVKRASVLVGRVDRIGFTVRPSKPKSGWKMQSGYQFPKRQLRQDPDLRPARRGVHQPRAARRHQQPARQRPHHHDAVRDRAGNPDQSIPFGKAT
nr:MlaD family protein [uncultured Noviherbaspirillum sp.]